MDILKIDNISAGYDSKIIIKNINITLKENESIAIVGESGSGKTTLVKAITHMCDIYSGDILFEGNSILKKDEYTYKKLTKLYIKDGVIDKELHDELFDIMKSQKHYFDSLAKVSPERKRLENPHSYKVDLSSDLINLKYGLINKIKNV